MGSATRGDTPLRVGVIGRGAITNEWEPVSFAPDRAERSSQRITAEDGLADAEPRVATIERSAR